MLATLDWLVVAIICPLWWPQSVFVTTPGDAEDYFVAGNSAGPIIALSVMATQCSTNSILGHLRLCLCRRWTRLVAVRASAAVAMIFIAIFLIPVFHRQRLVSVYLYLGGV